MADNKIKIEIAVNKTGNGAEQVENSLDKLSVKTRNLGSSFEALGGAIGAAFAGIAIVQSIKDFGSAVLDTGVKMQSLMNAFKTSEGGADRATQAFGFVRDEADRLGLNLDSAANGFIKISAAAMGTKLAGEETRKIFSAITEAGTALGLSSDEVNGALLAIGQMMSKGKVQAEELRGQLGERIPGAFQIAASAMGMTTAQLDKFMAEGKAISEDFIPKFADAMHNRFAKSAIDASTSMQASLNRLSTAWTNLKSSVFDSVEQFGAASRAMAALTLTIQGFTPNKAPAKGSTWSGSGTPDQESVAKGISSSLPQITIGMTPEEIQNWIQYTEEIKNAGSELKSVQTPQDRYSDAVARANQWLKDGVITLEAYNSLISEAQKKLDAASGATQKFKKAQDEANAVVQSILTPGEKFEYELAKLNELMNAGVLSSDKYGRALQKLKEQMFKESPGQNDLENRYMALQFKSYENLTSDLKDQVQPALEKTKGMFKELNDAIEGFGQQGAEAIANFATGASTSFSSMIQSILKDIVKLIAYKTITQPIASGVSGLISGALSSLLGSSASYSGSIYSPATSATAVSSLAGQYHSGGIVGAYHSGSIRVSPSIFAHAPRLHSGLAADEFPAILQAGEEVRSRGQVAADRSSARNAGNVKINLMNNTGVQTHAKTKDAPRWDGKQWVQDIILEAVNGGNTSLMYAIQSLKG